MKEKMMVDEGCDCMSWCLICEGGRDDCPCPGRVSNEGSCAPEESA